ncbi:rod shape-determining protein MreC [Rubricoccus marinus]|uniref:Cell shape-determining protein MreC n=1 Tax=Rubricoccus marinus TaxID=716817 RepID=A0A259TZM9_9BACT|nr:rod shape-determining protein MreC [Rubricoccus marinus]OZC03150.1 rod shape-determining protein MreC [Rubricoccus marinus]
MSNPAAQVWLRTRDYVLLAVLVLIATAIFVGRNRPALRAARSVALAVTGPVEGTFSRVGRFRRSLGENERLRAEALDLSTEVARLREARAENARLRGLLGFADSLDVSYRVARIVTKDQTEQANFLTIDVGEADSIQVGMPVIDERGIVGKVFLVGDNYSVVMPHQNTQFTVPATLDALALDGLISWDGRKPGTLTMEFVPKTEPVERGMLVTTSPYSGVFPAGVPVGRVDTAYAAAGRNDFIIEVTPAAPISQVGYVYVLLSVPDVEIETLLGAARDSLATGAGG